MRALDLCSAFRVDLVVGKGLMRNRDAVISAEQMEVSKLLLQ